MSTGIFITGTNTNIGKTWVSALLMSAAHSHGIAARYFKPVQTGSDCDCTTVKKLTGLADENIIKPLFCFQAPLAPYRAALLENKYIDLDLIVDRVKKKSSSPYLVEGAGGLLVPLTEKYLIRDLIKILDLPIIIVASTQLGTINHTLLTLEAAQAADIKITGLVLSGECDLYLVDTLKQFTSIPVIAEIPVLNDVTAENFTRLATQIFSKNLLQSIFA